MNSKYVLLLLVLMVFSCASKKEVLYLQDANENNTSQINYQETTIQPNDILKIDVETLVPEAAAPYSQGTQNTAQIASLQLMQIKGYLVSNEGTINFPVLGKIKVGNLMLEEAEEKIKSELVSGGHLNDPKIRVRIVNAKVTVLGEVNSPGTFNFTEQNITLLQALGYAGDLTINGKREDIIMTRDIDGVRQITHIDITKTDFMNSEFYYIKPNDVIIVNPNNPKVSSAGYIGNVPTLLGIGSILLTSIILLTR